MRIRIGNKEAYEGNSHKTLEEYSILVPGRAYAPGSRHAISYKASVRREASKKILRPVQGSLYIRVLYYFSDPKSRVDGDNLLKIICDALKGIAYQDDSQIDDHRVIRRGLNSSTKISDIARPSLIDYIAKGDFVIIELGEAR